MNLTVKPLTLLTALIFSCVVVLPFLPPEKPGARPYAFEVQLVADVPGHAQVYYDLGAGYSESNSSRQLIERSAAPLTVRFPLPAKTIHALRFDPSDRPGRIALAKARIVAPDGSTVARFSPSDFSSEQQIASLEIADALLRIATEPSATDPILQVALRAPLALPSEYSLLGVAWKPVLLVFASLAVGWMLVAWTVRHRREWLRAMGGHVAASARAWPGRTIALAAFVGVALSSYPVVFCGRSFVSPSFRDGTYLLYDRLPTLPGTSATETEDARGSDVGAIFWAHIPYSFVQSRALLVDGELPLWNRYNSCGTVLLGQGQSMFGDPLHLPVILAGGAAWAWDLKFLFAKWLLCCGLGLTVWHAVRHLPSTLLATLSAAFLGFFVFRLNHPAVFSFCYGPWILYAWLRLSQATSIRSITGWCTALVLACTAELHSGTVKEAYMLLLGLNLSGAFVIGFADRPGRERLRLLAAAIWAGCLFVLLTAPTWLTFLDDLKRAYTSYNAATGFQIHPSLALGLFDEIFYRPIQRGELVVNPSANFVVLLGVLYFFAAFRVAGRSAVARGVAWSALLPAALVFGVLPPQWIVKIPFVANVAHIDNTFSCVLIIQLSVLAGFGWRAAHERLGTPAGNGDLVRLAWGYVLLVVPWIAFMHVVHRPTYGDAVVVSLLHWGHRVPVSVFVWTSLWVLSVAGAVLLLSLRRVLRQRRLEATSGLLICLALGAILWRHGAHLPQTQPDDYVFTPGPRLDFHARSDAIAAVQADQPEPTRAVGLGGNLFPGWSSAYAIEGVCGPDALINPYYRELLEAVGINRIWDWRIYVTAANLAAQKSGFDFLNVRHYLDLPGGGQPGGALERLTSADLEVYRSRSTWPRAFFTRQVGVYTSPAEFGQMVRGDLPKPFAAVQQNDEPKWLKFVKPVSKITEPGIAARDYRLTTNSTAFTVDASGPGLAVLHEAWLHREFEAMVDDQPARVLRVNHAFKGVAIPSAGPHRVVFTYRPRRFTLALSLAAVGSVLALASGLTVWRLSRRPPAPPASAPRSGATRPAIQQR